MNAKLETLNAYRARAGKAPLKAWKESNAKLEAAIAKFAKEDVTFDAKEAADHKAEVNGATITLADIAREIGANPKVVRAFARRNIADIRDIMIGDKWVFAVSAKARIITFLTK